MQNHYVSQNYLETEVQSASPLQLVRLLYQGALEAVVTARSALGAGDILTRSRKISKATLILNELALNLDHSKGGEISRSLAELYDYMARRLNEANFQQVDAPLAEVQDLLQTLSEAWTDCSVQPVAPMLPDYRATAPEYQPLSCTA